MDRGFLETWEMDIGRHAQLFAQVLQILFQLPFAEDDQLQVRKLLMQRGKGPDQVPLALLPVHPSHGHHNWMLIDGLILRIQRLAALFPDLVEVIIIVDNLDLLRFNAKVINQVALDVLGHSNDQVRPVIKQTDRNLPE